jgi:N utilization substance protein B
MTRTNAREIAIHFTFALSFSDLNADELLAKELNRETFQLRGAEEPLYAEYPNEKQLGYITALVKGVHVHGPELDDYIARYALGWSFSRISRVAAAIMRVAMYEILYMPDIPNSAAINEAVEIAKGYEEPQVVSFINGILGSFVRAEFPGESGSKPEVNAAAEEPQAPEEE